MFAKKTYVYIYTLQVSGTNPGQNMDTVDTLPMDMDAMDSILAGEPPKLFHITLGLPICVADSRRCLLS